MRNPAYFQLRTISTQEIRRRGDGATGRQGDAEMGRRGDAETGRRGDTDTERHVAPRAAHTSLLRSLTKRSK
ncbi:MAG: hypothetical protein C5B55_10975 [Blastocatellia bacterium]|nr:MAG: hypothetical protein C5B55_10975 [Blastocatellia bacterium]